MAFSFHNLTWYSLLPLCPLMRTAFQQTHLWWTGFSMVRQGERDKERERERGRGRGRGRGLSWAKSPSHLIIHQQFHCELLVLVERILSENAPQTGPV